MATVLLSDVVSRMHHTWRNVKFKNLNSGQTKPYAYIHPSKRYIAMSPHTKDGTYIHSTSMENQQISHAFILSSNKYWGGPHPESLRAFGIGFISQQQHQQLVEVDRSPCFSPFLLLLALAIAQHVQSISFTHAHTPLWTNHTPIHTAQHWNNGEISSNTSTQSSM